MNPSKQVKNPVADLLDATADAKQLLQSYANTDFASGTHTHILSDVDELVDALASKYDSSHVGTTANKLVQLTAAAKLPAVDGSLLFATTQTMVGAATTSNYVETYELNNFGRSVPDNIHYRGINTDGALLTHPQVGFGLENYFVVDGTDQKLVEYNFDYTSIDRAVEYRPETFAIDCDTHKAYLENRLASHKIGHRLQGTGIYPAWQWVVDTDTNRIACYGSLGIGDFAGDADADYARFRVTGTSGTSTNHVLIDPTALADNGRVVNIEVPAQTGSSVTYVGLRAAGTVKGTLLRVLHNQRGNADAVAKDYIVAENGDAFTVYQTGGTPTCIGSDASAGGNWKVDIGATPGSGTVIEADQSTRALLVPISVNTPRVNFDALNYITDTGGNSMAMKCNQFFAFDIGYFLVRSYNGATTYAYMDTVTWDFRLPVKMPAVVMGYTAKTANYTILTTDYTINCTTNTFALTLPTAVGATGQVYNLKNSGSGVITINTTSSQTIDGSASGSLTLNQYDSYTLQSDGANWIIL